MLTIDQNKRIAEALGLCWPGIKLRTDSFFKDLGYDSWPGFRLIIENGPEQDWWISFVNHNSHVFMSAYIGEIEWAIKQDYIGPKLGIALAKWLERKGKK